MTEHTFPVLTYPEAAEYLRLSLSTVKNLVQRGDLPAITLGFRNRRIRRVDLDEYIARRAEPRAVEPFSYPGAGLVRNRKVRSS